MPNSPQPRSADAKLIERIARRQVQRAQHRWGHQADHIRDDVVQDVALACVEAKKRTPPYLGSVAWRSANKSFCKRLKNTDVGRTVSFDERRYRTVSPHFSDDAKIARMALRRISALQVDVLWLKAAGWKHSEIGQRLDCPAGTSRSHHTRGLQQLRDLVETTAHSQPTYQRIIDLSITQDEQDRIAERHLNYRFTLESCAELFHSYDGFEEEPRQLRALFRSLVNYLQPWLTTEPNSVALAEAVKEGYEWLCTLERNSEAQAQTLAQKRARGRLYSHILWLLLETHHQRVSPWQPHELCGLVELGQNSFGSVPLVVRPEHTKSIAKAVSSTCRKFP